MPLATLAQTFVFVACLAAIAGWDLRRRRIPNSINIATAVLGLAAALATGSLTAVGQALAGGALLFALLVIAWRQRWIGGGDVKLGAALGTWLGPIGGLYAMCVGVALGGVLAGFLLVRGGQAFRTEVKANLVMAAYTGRVGDTSHRPDAAHIPLGAAFAASALLVFLLRGSIGA
jgi:prepilin peptidase CpaA